MTQTDLLNPSAVAGNNEPPLRFKDRKALVAHVKKLGEKKAAGEMTGPEFLVDVSIAVEEGIVMPSASEAQELWGSFRSAQISKQGDVIDLSGAHVVTDKAGDSREPNFKQKSSALAAVMKAAHALRVHGGSFSAVLGRSRPIIKQEKIAGNHKQNTFDSFVSIARDQLKTPENELSDERIAGALMPKEKTEKERTEATALDALIKAIQKHIDGTEGTDNTPPKEGFPSEEADDALNALKQRRAQIELAGLQTKRGK